MVFLKDAYNVAKRNPSLWSVINSMLSYMDEASRTGDPEKEKKMLSDLLYAAGIVLSRAAERFESLRGAQKLRIPWSFLKKMDDFNLGYPIIDHGEYVKQDGKYYFVSHSYNANIDDFKTLIEFCDKYDLRFLAHGSSWYFPAHTFTIMIYRKDYGPLGRIKSR